MKIQSLLVVVVIACSSFLRAQEITYRSPVPNSYFNSLETNIILRSEAKIDEGSLSATTIIVTGSISGVHAGTITLSDDRQTLLFQPRLIFTPSEEVTVVLNGEVKTVNGTMVKPERFSFTVTSRTVPLSQLYAVTEAGEVVPKTALEKQESPIHESALMADSLPSDFPKFKVDTSANPAPGNYFLTTSDDVAGVGHFAYMVDNNGKVVKYLRSKGHVYDFKVLPNGMLHYADPFSDWGYAGGSRCVHRIMDSTFALVDSFKAGNGYDSDTHEFMMMPNGHVVLHAYDIQYMDLSKIVAGGNANAIVVGSVIQELDLQKNVVFQWRSWDHVPVTETYMVATASAFDYIHVNAYDLDDDGNLLVCFRNTCEIVKLNRMTGEFMWRMGGKNNQFTFIGENEVNKPNYYTFQHSFNRLPNGNLIMFDNGNLHTPAISRGVEYRIDQVKKIATMVWQYRHTPDVYAPTRGSVQRLQNGNTVIGWGSASFVGVGMTMITELNPANETIFEMESLDKMPSYRALKFVWNEYTVPAAKVTIVEVLPGNAYTFTNGGIRTGVTITLLDAAFGYNSLTVKKYLYAPVKPEYFGLAPVVHPVRFIVEQTGISSFTGDIVFDSTVTGAYAQLNKAVVYAREFEGTGMFIPLTTVYDAVKKTLTATTTKFGEFILGIPDEIVVPPLPSLVAPVQNALVNQTKPVLIRWSTAGHITGSHLQIAKDSTFANPIYNDSTLSSSYALWNVSLTNAKYFWRSKALNERGKSAWSSTGIFTASGVYISVLYPTGNVKFLTNTTYQLQYQNNFDERVNIRLYRNGMLVLKVKDSTENTGRYLWKIPATGLGIDSTYTIRVCSVLDSTITASSPVFAIAATLGVPHEASLPGTYSLNQNFPNPFNPSTTINYGLPGACTVSLKIYNVLGQQVADLVQGEQTAGWKSVTWNATVPTGLYFYRLDAVKVDDPGSRFVEVKKMLLVK